MRKGCAQQIPSLAVELGVHEGEARKIPARPREAGSETPLHRVHYDWPDNRNVAAHGHDGLEVAIRHDDIDW
jgi:hypothetical protein